MFRKQRQSSYGAWHINTAQAIIILIAVGCAGVVFNAYQEAHQPPPTLALTAVTPKPDPKQARYTAQVQTWQAKMAQQQMSVTWPYLGQDNVVRVDLPGKVPITLIPWDDAGERDAAAQAYHGFTSARVKARITNPAGCIVHVFSADGVEVAQASAVGVVTSADQNLGT